MTALPLNPFPNVTAAAEWVEGNLLGVIYTYNRAKAIVNRIRARGIRSSREASDFLKLSAFVNQQAANYAEMMRAVDTFLVRAGAVAPDFANRWNSEIGRTIARTMQGLNGLGALPAVLAAVPNIVLGTAAAAALIAFAGLAFAIWEAGKGAAAAIKVYAGARIVETIDPNTGQKTTTTQPAAPLGLGSPLTLLALAALALFAMFRGRRR